MHWSWPSAAGSWTWKKLLAGIGRLRLSKTTRARNWPCAYLIDAVRLIPDLREACKSAPPAMLEALNSAMTFGSLMGLTSTWQSWWHYYRRQPDAIRGQGVKHGASAGGRNRWSNRDDIEDIDQANNWVRELHADFPGYSWCHICRRVGAKMGRSERQIRNWTKSIQWPTPKSPR